VFIVLPVDSTGQRHPPLRDVLRKLRTPTCGHGSLCKNLYAAECVTVCVLQDSMRHCLPVRASGAGEDETSASVAALSNTRGDDRNLTMGHLKLLPPPRGKIQMGVEILGSQQQTAIHTASNFPAAETVCSHVTSFNDRCRTEAMVVTTQAADGRIQVSPPTSCWTIHC